MNRTWLPILAAAALSAAPAANAGEDLLLLAAGTPLPPHHAALDEQPARHKPPPPEKDPPQSSVNVVKITLPPLTRPERGVLVTQSVAVPRKTAKDTSPAPKDAIFSPSPIPPLSEWDRTILVLPAPALTERENAIPALSPFDVFTEIPGCVTPDIVAGGKTAPPHSAAGYTAAYGSLLDLPAMDAFPELTLPVASPGISPSLPEMPVYRDAAVETLAPFTPAPAHKAPRPEEVRLPVPLASRREAALAQLQPIASVASPASTASSPQGFFLPPPPDAPMLLTASAPVAGFPGGGGGGGMLLTLPPGVALTASVPMVSPVRYSPPPAAPVVMEEKRPPARKSAPSFAERNVPTVASSGGEGGFTPVRGIRNILGQ